MNKYLWLLMALPLLSGCESQAMLVNKDDAAFAPPTAAAAPTPEGRAGGVFQAGYNWSLTADRRAYRVGDILTVILDESTQSSKQAKTNFDKSSSLDIAAPTIFGKTKDKLESSADADRSFDGGASSQQQNSLHGSITVSVHQVLPNGVMEIRGDAKSLRGGTLLLTQLHGADGEVYALAQGNVVVGGMNASGASGSSVTVNTPTSGRIPNGASVEREIPSDFGMSNAVMLNLKRPSFKDANNIAAAINRAFGGGLATAKSSTNVEVIAPTDAGARVAFMSQLEDVQVQAERVRARVVFNARTGTVVMGDGVALHAAAVSHGNLTVSISETTRVSQPNAMARGRTVASPDSNVNVDHARPQMIALPESTSLKTLVSVLNGLGASPDDVMSILQALHEAGALDADLEVI